jgi:hypothetical protein
VVVVAAFFSKTISVVLLALAAASAFAQQEPAPTQLAQAQSARELRESLDTAKREAANSQGLDAAYELVGIADAAQTSNIPDIIKDAVSALNSVVERATLAAMTASVEDAQDTLDQLVDLSFFSRTSNIAGADAALQKSLRTLFPKMTSDLRQTLAKPAGAPEQWAKALTSLGLLAELQAAATLMMLDDIAVAIAQTYDTEAGRLEDQARQIADSTQMGKAMEELAGIRKIYDEQIADAKANNLATVAADMAKPGRVQPRDEESAEASADLSGISMACTEIGMIVPPGMASNWDGLLDVLPKLEEDCVLSGRAPTENRCTARDISFVCREPTSDIMEQLSFVYLGTPEERIMRESCKGERLSPAQLAGTGAVFKNTAMRRIITCSPVPNGARGLD